MGETFQIWEHEYPNVSIVSVALELPSWNATIDSLKNPRNHKSLIHKIRGKVTALEGNNWKIQLTWVKAPVGLYGNEMADKLAKETATERSLQSCYDKIPKSELTDESIAKWETEWCNTNNGKVTKSFFPYVRD